MKSTVWFAKITMVVWEWLPCDWYLNSAVKNVYFFNVRNIEVQSPSEHTVGGYKLLKDFQIWTRDFLKKWNFSFCPCSKSAFLGMYFCILNQFLPIFPLPSPQGLFRIAIKKPWGAWHMCWSMGFWSQDSTHVKVKLYPERQGHNLETRFDHKGIR